MITNATTPGPLRVLILDITTNSQGFEHEVSETISAALREAGVVLTKDSPVFVADDAAFYETFEPCAADFNCLVLVAHGGPDPGTGHVSALDGPSGVSEWYSLVEMTNSLQDKFVALCVCDGYCKDAKCALVTNTSLCLSFVGPAGTLTAEEARLFFPAFLAMVHSGSITSVDPNHIRSALDRTNELAGGKMRLYSQGESVS